MLIESKENRKAHRELVEAIRLDSAVAFAGAGVSARLGYPDWGALINELADEAEKLNQGKVIDVLCGYIQHPEIKSLGPNGDKCRPETRGLLQRISIKGGLQHAIGKEISRFEQGQDDFIENMDDACIQYEGGRVAANESLKAEIKKLGLRKTTKETGLDRKTIRAVLSGEKVKVSTLAKVVNGLQSQWKRPTGGRFPGMRKGPK
ncbi:MAG: hypothetical protein WA737_02755 [Candidatus Acidiferrales bacterium]